MEREQEELASAITPGDIHTLPNALTYTVGNGSLYIFDDGQLFTVSEDYTETTISSVTFLRPIRQGSNMTYVVLDTGTGGFTNVRREEEILFSTIMVGDPAHILPSGLTYAPGTGTLYVFDDGQLLVLGEDYSETSTNSITFLRRTRGGSNMTYVVPKNWKWPTVVHVVELTSTCGFELSENPYCMVFDSARICAFVRAYHTAAPVAASAQIHRASSVVFNHQDPTAYPWVLSFDTAGSTTASEVFLRAVQLDPLYANTSLSVSVVCAGATVLPCVALIML